MLSGLPRQSRRLISSFRIRTGLDFINKDSTNPTDNFIGAGDRVSMGRRNGDHLPCYSIDFKNSTHAERTETSKTGSTGMNDSIRKLAVFLLAVYLFCFFNTAARSQIRSEPKTGLISDSILPVPGSRPASPVENRILTEADCTAAKLGSTPPVSAIGKPVSRVTLDAPVWTGATNSIPAYCSVNGSMAPIDTSTTAQPIHFRVVLSGGADWQPVRSDGDVELYARYTLKATDGSLIQATNQVLIHIDGKTGPYIRPMMDFEAPSASPHAWLNHAIFLGTRTMPQLMPKDTHYVIIGVHKVL